jgi:hypothetical protein
MIHHLLGVAVIAARRDFLAPDPRVERVIAPFNFAILSHLNNSALNVGSLMNIHPSIVQFTRFDFRYVPVALTHSPGVYGWVKDILRSAPRRR